MIDTTLQPNMEAVSVPGMISGESIVNDLLDRIGEQLFRDCNLRASDCYRGYAAKLTCEIQLLDVYPVTVSAQVAVGALNPQLPSRHIALDSEASGEKPDFSHLEKPIDPTGFVPQALTPQKRGRGRPRKYPQSIRSFS